MASEQELKKVNPQHKEFQNLLDKDFKDRKLKENGNRKPTKNNRKQETNQKSDPRKFRSSARKAETALGKIAGIGVIGRCA